MKCIIHLGPPKTGSTSIQTFLRKNKSVLLENGVLALAGNGMPEKLLYLFKSDDSLLRRFRNLNLQGGKEKIRRYKRDADRHIKNNISEHSPSTLLLTSELLALLKNKELVNMREYVSSFASEIELIFYLRRPDFRATSGYKNRIKNRGETKGIDSDYKNTYDDGKTIKRLGRIFGCNNITPIICGDSHPEKTKAESHIDSLLGVIFKDKDLTRDIFTFPERRNAAWDYKAIYFMREFNRIVMDNPGYEKYRKPLSDLLEKNFSNGEKIKIDKSVAQAIVDKYKNKWDFIRKNYFPDQNTLYNMDFSMYDSGKNSQPFGIEESVLVSLILLKDTLDMQNKGP